MKKILVTGGAGFVGSNMAILFKKHYPDVDVCSFDNLKRRGSELTLNRLKENGVRFIHGDLRNESDFEELEAFDTIIDCAAEPSVLAGVNSSPKYLLDTNLTGTLNLLEYVRKHNSDIIFLSTSRVYPINLINELKYTETKTRFELSDDQVTPGASSLGYSEKLPIYPGPRSLYGATKLSSELVMQEYLDTYGIKGVINRCGVLTGPWQMGKVDQGVIVFWLASHLAKKNLGYFGYGGQGKQVRDILHVEDLFDLVKIQLANLNDYSGEIFNVGGGREVSVSLNELTTIAEKLSGNKLDIKSVMEDRANDIRIYLTDTTKIKNASGWSPKKDTNVILEDIYRWIVENRTLLESILF